MDAKSCSRDAISWLPDEVLGKILSFLPTKQAVTTSVLSRKWRNVFRLVHNLHIDDSVLVHPGAWCYWYVFPESFKSFVDQTLELLPIKKFSLKCHLSMSSDCEKTCVRRWISNVVERGVLELDLSITDQDIECMPPQLFASKTLVKLTLGTQLSFLELPSDVSLPSLKTLFLNTVLFEYDDSFSVLLAGCTVLEELSVHHSYQTVAPSDTISNPTVKRLSVNYSSCDVKIRSCMSFDLPKLIYLEYSHFALCNYPKVNMESLVEAKLDLYPVKEKNWTPDVTNLLKGIRNVKILHLSPVSVDVICFHCRYQLPVFNNLVKLSFGSNKNCWRLLPQLIKLSPNLETLIIQDLSGYTCNDVYMPPNKVKVLRILGYRETVRSLKLLKSFVGGFKCLEVVQVDDLKRLSVNYSPCDVKIWSSISFDLPKLVYLEYSQFALRNYPQFNMESLVEAKLDLYPVKEKDWIPNVTNLLKGIRNVKILHLSPVSVHVIYSRCRYELVVFNNLVKLYFGSKKKRCWKLLAYLLKHSPKLETLIIQDLDSEINNDAFMYLEKVKVLHILSYGGTDQELNHLKSFLGKTESLEVVQVDVTAKNDSIIVETKSRLMMHLGVSIPSNCQIKVSHK